MLHHNHNILVSLAAGAGEVVTAFDGITTMGEMTSTICNNAEIGETTKLLDTSTGNEGRSYQITKLADRNCWMTQNLNNSTGRMTYSSGSGYKPEYGGYYSWENAITVCENLGSGWMLPSSWHYAILTAGMSNSATLITAPYNFQYSGLVNNDLLYNTGSHGCYWSSTANGGTNAYNLLITSDNVNPSDVSTRSYGRSVRCVAR